MSVTTHTPPAASRVAVAPVARTLSMEADWISVATVPMLTMFTCAREGTRVVLYHTNVICLLNYTFQYFHVHGLCPWESYII